MRLLMSDEGAEVFNISFGGAVMVQKRIFGYQALPSKTTRHWTLGWLGKEDGNGICPVHLLSCPCLPVAFPYEVFDAPVLSSF